MIGLSAAALADWSVCAFEPWVISSVVPIHTDFAFGRKIFGFILQRNIIPRIDHFVVSPVGEGLAQ